MFYQFTKEGMVPIEPEHRDSGVPTAGYVTAEELQKLNPLFGFEESTVAACRNAKEFFRTGVEVYKDYTFSELRILNADEEKDDYIALYIRKNLLLVVDIADEDGSTKNKFLSSIARHPASRVSCEKLLAAFLDSLLTGDHAVLESIENDLSGQEEALIAGEVDRDFNISLLQLKKQLTQRHSYYAQLMDIADAVYENDNDIFEESSLIYIDNTSKRIQRLKEETAGLRSTVEHLQDAYSSYLDMGMNKTMKTFTVLTSIFFPLTIIVGWYGMNFENMPEFAWKFGYLYVIALSVVTILVFALIGKKKKWF